MFDNNREGWFNNQEDHPLSIDKHCEKIHCWVNMLEGKIGFWTDECGEIRENTQRMLVPKAEHFFPDGYYLMQDNAPSTNQNFL